MLRARVGRIAKDHGQRAGDHGQQRPNLDGGVEPGRGCDAECLFQQVASERRQQQEHRQQDTDRRQRDQPAGRGGLVIGDQLVVVA